MESAVVLCEGSFGETMGKTANGLVRYSKRYRIVGVLDSTKAGRDGGEVLDGRRNGIPIFAGVREALAKLPERPSTVIVGVATFGGDIPKEFRPVIREAIEAGPRGAGGGPGGFVGGPPVSNAPVPPGRSLVRARQPR